MFINPRHIIVALTILAVLPTCAWSSDGVFVNSFLAQIEHYALESSNGLTILIVIALATLVSEDLACIAAGLLAAKAVISIPAAVAASALGIYIGDILLYLTGYLVGVAALDHNGPYPADFSTISELLACNLRHHNGLMPGAACLELRDKVASMVRPDLRAVSWHILGNLNLRSGLLTQAVEIHHLALVEAEQAGLSSELSEIHNL